MNKNEKLLAEFMAYCAEHPELRFWQALLAFVKQSNPEIHRIELVDDDNDDGDTFYFENLID